MTRTFCTLPSAFLALFFSLFALPAAAQNCDEFVQSFVTSKEQTQQAPRPFGNDLLLKNADSTRCLIDILDSMQSRVLGPNLSDEDAARIIQVTGGLRTILANGGRAGIDNFRITDRLDTIITLTALARGPNQTARINAAVILADVIDNNGLCVVMDHLYDSSLKDTEDGKSGRVNLISIASVVAPWANKENFDNLQRLVAYLKPVLADDPDARRASELFENLVQRVDFQSTVTNPPKDRPLPPGLRDCYRYTPLFANKNGDKQLIYGE